MNNIERFHRWSLEFIAIGVFFWVLSNFWTAPLALTIAVLLAHTLNALLNGQIVAVLAHDVRWLSFYRDRARFIAYVEDIQKRLEQKSPACLREVLIFGSLTRGIFRETSDLDIRFIAADGFWNALCAAHYVFIERARACLHGFPLDAYMFRTREETERKMRVREERAIRLYRRSPSEPPIADDALRLEDLKQSITTARAEQKPPRVIILGAGGGHLLEAQLATDGVPMRRVIATFRLPHTTASLKGERCYYLTDPHGKLFKYAWNFAQSFWLVLRERPHAIINTGGGMTIATSLLGKFFGARLIYIESAARVHNPSRTGRLLYPYADLFLVQWEPLLKELPKAKYGGPLL